MKKPLILLSLLSLSILLYACANTSSMARKHPMEVSGMPNCAECHTNAWKSLNHKAPDFYKKHRFYAGSMGQSCTSCHSQASCNECHTRKDELKPSEKFSNAPSRNFPHRGDYMTQHKIDGRLDPSSCVKCHGRQNNGRCITCHR